MTKHDILPQYHHGSRRGHSTLTATQSIQQCISSNKDNIMNTAVIMTDLGSAFDTCEHSLLTEKLEHIGFREISLETVKSFLSDRKIFVEIQGYFSNMMNLCS